LGFDSAGLIGFVNRTLVAGAAARKPRVPLDSRSSSSLHPGLRADGSFAAFGTACFDQTTTTKMDDTNWNLGFATNVSPDAQAATVLFDNLLVELEPARAGARSTHNQTAVQTKVATLHIPYATDQRSVTMTLDLRGFVDADSVAPVRLVACVGDKTAVIDLSADIKKRVNLNGKSKEVLSESHPDA